MLSIVIGVRRWKAVVDREMLRRYYEIVRIPIQLHDETGLAEDFDTHGFKPNPANHIVQGLLKMNYPISYTVSDELLECGVVRIKNSNRFLVVGPSTNLELTRSQAQNIIAGIGQPQSRVNELMRWLNSIPNYDISRFRGNLCFLDYALNGQNHDPVQVPYETQGKGISSIEMDMDYEQHANRLLEDDIISCIEYGRPEELDRAFTKLLSDNKNVPLIASTALRTYKSLIVMAIGIASRAAVRGGLDYDRMNMIVEHYLQKVEVCESQAQLSYLFRQVYIDFAQRVALVNTITSDSLVVKRISKEIHSRLYEKLTPTVIADRLNMNCSYLCRHFKQETGKTITEYINEVKVKECMRLLDSTELPIVQISALLGFSSQNYLHTVFRKITGMTPNDFRKRKSKV